MFSDEIPFLLSPVFLLALCFTHSKSTVHFVVSHSTYEIGLVPIAFACFSPVDTAAMERDEKVHPPADQP